MKTNCDCEFSSPLLKFLLYSQKQFFLLHDYKHPSKTVLGHKIHIRWLNVVRDIIRAVSIEGTGSPKKDG